MCVCVCDEYGVQAIYITMQVCIHAHICFAQNSVRNKNPISLHGVQTQYACECSAITFQNCPDTMSGHYNI